MGGSVVIDIGAKWVEPSLDHSYIVMCGWYVEGNHLPLF